MKTEIDAIADKIEGFKAFANILKEVYDLQQDKPKFREYLIKHFSESHNPSIHPSIATKLHPDRHIRIIKKDDKVILQLDDLYWSIENGYEKQVTKDKKNKIIKKFDNMADCVDYLYFKKD